MVFFPRLRSRKKTKGLPGVEFAADGFLDFEPFSAIVVRYFIDQFAGLIAFSNHRCRNATTSQRWATKRYMRIDHNNPRFIKMALSGEWVETSS
jgi:hypothetical protein